MLERVCKKELLAEKVKGVYSSFMGTYLKAMGRQLPYGITQCYLPPNTSQPGHTRFTYPRGIEG